MVQGEPKIPGRYEHLTPTFRAYGYNRTRRRRKGAGMDLFRW